MDLLPLPSVRVHKGDMMTREPDYEADLQNLLDAGFTDLYLWILDELEPVPEGAREARSEHGVRFAFRLTKEERDVIQN